MHLRPGSWAIGIGILTRACTSIRASKPEPVDSRGALLCDEGSVVRAIAAWQYELVAGNAEGLVPGSCKAREKLFDCATADRDA